MRPSARLPVGACPFLCFRLTPAPAQRPPPGIVLPAAFAAAPSDIVTIGIEPEATKNFTMKRA